MCSLRSSSSPKVASAQFRCFPGAPATVCPPLPTLVLIHLECPELLRSLPHPSPTHLQTRQLPAISRTQPQRFACYPSSLVAPQPSLDALAVPPPLPPAPPLHTAPLFTPAPVCPLRRSVIGLLLASDSPPHLPLDVLIGRLRRRLLGLLLLGDGAEIALPESSWSGTQGIDQSTQTSASRPA